MIFSSSLDIELDLDAVEVLGGGKVVFIITFPQALHRRSVHKRQ